MHQCPSFLCRPSSFYKHTGVNCVPAKNLLLSYHIIQNNKISAFILSQSLQIQMSAVIPLICLSQRPSSNQDFFFFRDRSKHFRFMRKVSHLGKKADFPFVNLTVSNIRRDTSKIFRSQRLKVVTADVMHLIRRRRTLRFKRGRGCWRVAGWLQEPSFNSMSRMSACEQNCPFAD